MTLFSRKDLIQVENAAEFLLIAELHDQTILKKNVTKFIAAHCPEVVATEGWKQLLQTRPDLVNQVLCASFKKTVEKEGKEKEAIKLEQEAITDDLTDCFG
jgi:hypothetical protein